MKDLTKGNPSKLIIQFAIPIFIGNIFQLFYSLADTRIVGSTLGDEALAAVGATSTINNLIIGFLIGLTNGFAIIVARDFGAQKLEQLRKDLGGTLKLGIAISLLLTVISVIFLEPILRLLNMPEALMTDGIAYIRVILLGMTAAMLYNVCASVLRAIGDTITPLIFLIFSTIMNIGLDYLLILGFHTGVAGAAYATVISQSVAAIMCFVYIWKRYPMLHLRKSDFIRDSKLEKSLLISGLSMGMMQSLVSLGTVALQGAINTLGTYTIVAHTGARKITEIFMLPFGVLGMTMATYCGQNLGAGEITRIQKGLKQVILVAWIWCALVVVASYTIAPVLVRLVTATSTKEVIETASLYLRIDTLVYFIPAMISILRNALQGIGDHITPIVSSFIELIGKVLIAIYLTPYLKYMGIILAEPIVWVLMVIPLIIRIYTIPQLKGEKKLNAV
ncbi:MAG: MATE family efflux transporter [Candidatus Cellulosilyticum pullistercoris]|uniref:Probable multidrug resistance protein NorM n=1 Tax=Candidatus Cellulosilyticum pullistercoris TaxID=2838521 RepID=A0A9E2KC22_9FIRM|nr:MATE family efflux transporter [Candidatus Cellulosilyticum pullistercoris]